jgi:hypothetical protein
MKPSTFLPTPIPICSAQVGVFLKGKKLYYYTLFVLCVSTINFLRLKINHIVGLQVLAFLLELGVWSQTVKLFVTVINSPALSIKKKKIQFF